MQAEQLHIDHVNCPVCYSHASLAFNATVLKRHKAEYFVCSNCAYLFTPKPYWLDEAYTSAIASTDTGLVKRNISISSKLASILYFGMNERGQGRYKDIAGGYGMLTRMMRDLGFNFYWEDKYCSNLLAQGFEYRKDHGTCDTVTAFEVLEHVTNPVSFIEAAMLEAGADTIIFSTVLYDGPPPDPNEWWYYGFSTGQHIGFFQKKTLQTIAKKLGLNFSTANKLHILSKRKINNNYIKIISNEVFSRLICYWIQFRLGSKSTSDHEAMIRNVR